MAVNDRDILLYLIMKNALLFFCLLFNYAGTAQELIWNGNFETCMDCPCYENSFDYSGWNTPGFGINQSYNACANKKYCTQGVPANKYGYQKAHSGNGYIGLSIYLPDTGAWGKVYQRTDTVFRYIETKLGQALKANTLYQFSAFVSMADSSAYAVSGFSVVFSEDHLMDMEGKKGLFLLGLPSTPVNYSIQKAHACDRVFIDNDTGWVKIFCTYLAKGNEKYLLCNTWPADCPYKKRDIHLSSAKKEFIHYYVDDITLVELADGASADKCRECLCSLKKRKDLHNTSYLLEKKSGGNTIDPGLDEIAGRMVSDTSLTITVGSEDLKSREYISYVAAYLVKKGVKATRIKKKFPSSSTSDGAAESIEPSSEGIEAVPVVITFDGENPG
jgi:hypothetical protein